MAISKNASINLLGMCIPLIVMLFSIPFYLDVIGTERFGILTICWTLLSFSSLFDFGLGRVLSQRVAALSSGRDGHNSISSIFWSAHWINFLLGLAGGLIFLLVGPKLFALLQTGDSLSDELLRSVPWLAATVPVLAMTSLLNGALEGRQHFFTINAVSVFASTAMIAAPLVMAILFSNSITLLIATCFFVRLFALPILYVVTFRRLRPGQIRRIEWPLVSGFLAFGSWVTLANLAGPLLEYFNGFAVGVVVAVEAVVLYTIPFSICSRISVIPASLAAALFPRFAAAANEQERSRLEDQAVRSISSMLTPIVLFALALGTPAFGLWLGEAMALAIGKVLMVMLAGFWSHAFIYAPYARLQASGRPKEVALVRTLELLPYWMLLLAATYVLGPLGAALAWAVRAWVEPFLFWSRTGEAFAHVRTLGLPAMLVVASAVTGLMLPPSTQTSFLQSAIAILGLWWSIHFAPAELKAIVKSVRWPFFRQPGP